MKDIKKKLHDLSVMTAKEMLKTLKENKTKVTKDVLCRTFEAMHLDYKIENGCIFLDNNINQVAFFKRNRVY